MSQELNETIKKLTAKDSEVSKKNAALEQEMAVRKASKGGDFSYIDHQLIKDHNDDLVFSMISNLTHRLDLSLRELTNSREGTIQMSNELKDIITQQVDQDEVYQADQEKRRKARGQQQLIYQLEDHIRLVEQQLNKKGHEQVKYIIKEQGKAFKDLGI